MSARFRLVLDVELDLAGEPVEEMKRRLNQVVKDALNNGTLTGDSPATVEWYEYNVILQKDCDHQTGYWINKPQGTFRCYKCGCQCVLEELPKMQRAIENWHQ